MPSLGVRATKMPPERPRPTRIRCAADSSRSASRTVGRLTAYPVSHTARSNASAPSSHSQSWAVRSSSASPSGAPSRSSSSPSPGMRPAPARTCARRRARRPAPARGRPSPPASAAGAPRPRRPTRRARVDHVDRLAAGLEPDAGDPGVHTRPPTRSPASSTHTSSPDAASRCAAARPERPAPTTTASCTPQRLHLGVAQLAPLARRAGCQPEAGIARAVQGPNGVPDRGQHPPHLAVSALVDRDLDPQGPGEADVGGRARAVVQLHALAQPASTAGSGRRPRSPRRSCARRDGDASAGRPAPRRLSAAGHRWCRGRAGRPGRAAPSSAPDRATVGRPFGSRAVVTTPAGLCSSTRSGPGRVTRRPSTRTSSVLRDAVADLGGCAVHRHPARPDVLVGPRRDPTPVDAR